MGQLMETQLVVASLNYSGILLSPFQFYSQELKKVEGDLSKIFQSEMKIKFPDYKRSTFKWKLGKIDQKIQKQRYTPIYRETVGIINGRMMNEEQFRDRWQKEMKVALQDNFKDLGVTEEQKKQALEFDLICYKTIFKYVYGTSDLKDAKYKPLKDYQHFMRKMFSKAFLDQQKKIEKALKAIDKQQVDIVFLQEANQIIAKAFDLKIFKVIASQTKQSLIVLRKSKFNHIYDHKSVLDGLGPQIKQDLTWNNDLCVAFADNLILVSAHLSSKTQKQQADRQKMFAGCQKLLQIYPNSHLIVGVDANQFIKSVPSALHIFPTKQNVNTSFKMRTMMQPQVGKAEQQVQKTIDFLITDLNMRKPKVVSILGKEAHSVGFLPCQQHPYDHFVVTANIYTQQI